MIKNTTTQYGLLAKLFHWFSALTIFSLFGLGYWMMTLDYSSQWYHSAPFWHKSIGIILFLVTGLRLLWRLKSIQPEPLQNHSTFERKASHITHLLLYTLMFLLFFAGYMVAATDGTPIDVTPYFTIPAIGEIIVDQEDIFGEIHEITAYLLIFLAVGHALAAIKHHLLDKDDTLKRMLK